MEAEKRLTDDDLVTIAQRLPLSRRQSFAAVDERAVGRAQVLEKVLTIAQSDSRVTARDFGLGIVCVEIDVRENASVGIPPSNLGFHFIQHELFAARSTTFDD